MNEEYEFEEFELLELMRVLQTQSQVFKDFTIEQMGEAYTKLFPPIEKVFNLSDERIARLEQFFMDKTLMDLIKNGMIDVLWCDEQNGFTLKITPKGEEHAKRILGQ